MENGRNFVTYADHPLLKDWPVTMTIRPQRVMGKPHVLLVCPVCDVVQRMVPLVVRTRPDVKVYRVCDECVDADRDRDALGYADVLVESLTGNPDHVRPRMTVHDLWNTIQIISRGYRVLASSYDELLADELLTEYEPVTVEEYEMTEFGLAPVSSEREPEEG